MPPAKAQPAQTAAPTRAWLRFMLLLVPLLGGLAVLLALSALAEGPSLAVKLDSNVKVETAEERAFEQRLEEIGAALPGTVGIAVVDVSAGNIHEFNGDEVLPQQSVSKLWVAMTALSQKDSGELDLGERVQIRRDDLTLFYQPIRDIVRTQGSFSSTFGDLMTRAISRSDNTANDRLLRRVGGPAKVQQWLDENGVAGVRFGTDERTKQSAIAGLAWNQFYSYRDEFYKARDRVPEEKRRKALEIYLADPVDGASANGIAIALARLARGELLSPPSTRLLRDTLAETRSGPRRLKGGVPDGWQIGHKTGTGQYFDGEQTGYNDVGIVTAPNGAEYAIAVMIGRTREGYGPRMDMMQAVTRATVEFHEAKLRAEAGELLARGE